jgi:hypothetical protein
MNTRKTVYNKLFTEKVELAKHEVELGMIQDYENKIELFRKENKQVVELI